MTFKAIIISLCLLVTGLQGSWAQTPNKKAIVKAPKSAPNVNEKTTIKTPTSAPTVNDKAEDLSNRLPLDFVKEMIQEGVWLTEYEDKNSAANLDISQFLNQLSQTSFSAMDLAEKTVVTPSTYLLKTSYLRYLSKLSASDLVRLKLTSKRLEEFKGALMTKYLDMTLALVRLSGIDEYGDIITEFKTQIRQKQISVVDLTPEKRWQIGQDENMASAHNPHAYNASVLSQKDERGRYVVSGLYSARRRVIALDLTRSIYETIVTFGHEIVHAADPESLKARQEMQSQFQNTAALFAEKVGTDSAHRLLSALLQDVFFEMGREDLVSYVKNDLVELTSSAREIRAEDLRKSTPKELQIELKKNPNVQGLIRNLIRVTVENEYKAYLFSLALYQTLSAKYQILPPSLDRKAFLLSQFNHQHSLQTTLSLAMNPFSKGAALENLRSSLAPEQERNIQNLKAILEINYLEQSKIMIEESAERFRDLFSIVSNVKIENHPNDDLPEWTKPGKFNSVTNPFQIVAAQVSTAHAIRFKASLDKFLRQMLELQESLVSMNAGILDLHDLSIGETKLLGLHPIDLNPKDILPQSIMEFSDKRALAKLLVDYYELNPELLSFLKTRMDVSFSLDNQSRKQSYAQSDLLQNLFKLRLLKTVLWLKNDFPETKESFIGIRTVQAKLFEGQYDQNEITPSRAQELIAELGKYIQAASGSLDEMRKIDVYMSVLAEIYLMASQSDWSALGQEYAALMLSSKRFLQNIGFEAKISVEEVRRQMNLDMASFKKQVLTGFSSCANERLGFYPTNNFFQLGRFKFRLTALCYDQRLYVLRQPMDYNRAATTFIIDGRPELRVFMSAKPIRLEPFQ